MIITAKNWWIFCCSWKYRLILAIIIKTLNGNCTLLPSICCQIYFSNWPPSPGIRDSLWLLVQLVLKHHVSFYSSFQGWAVCVILVVQAAEEGAKNVIAFWLYSCSPILTTVCSYTEVLGEKILTVFVVFPLVSPCCDAFFFFFGKGMSCTTAAKPIGYVLTKDRRLAIPECSQVLQMELFPLRWALLGTFCCKHAFLHMNCVAPLPQGMWLGAWAGACKGDFYF